MKIYIHHKYNKQLFYRFGHNTTNRIFQINESNGSGNVLCEYMGNPIEFIFTEDFNNDKTAFHIIDYYESVITGKIMREWVKFHHNIFDVPILQLIYHLIGKETNWIITMTRTEKLFGNSDTPKSWHLNNVESHIKKLNNHKIVHDNYFLNENIKSLYKNITYFAFTNTIMQWNQNISIRYYYEFKDVFERLNFDYDLCFSMRYVKTHRIEILKKLKELNNPKILLQRTDSIAVMEQKRQNKKFEDKNEDILKDIKLNSILGENDFANLTWIEYVKGINWDIFFRLLSKAKMQILDETFSWVENDIASIYLSEKTIGMILAGIPFISTHSYPLEILEKILGIEPHPFMEDFKTHKGNSDLFIKFVDKFMKNYDENYKLCKEWTNKCHELFIKKLESENSLLDLILGGFDKEDSNIKSINKII